MTFNVDGTTKTIPPKVRELIAKADRTLAFFALAVAAGTACNLPLVALPAGGAVQVRESSRRTA
jgi:hypothetical protein